jgi:hypothetical protein
LFYTQGCDLLAPNDVTKVTYKTVKADGVLDEARRLTVDAIVRARGGATRWRASVRAARTYGLFELPDAHCIEREPFEGVEVYDSPVIALAVFPAVAEALPFLREALGGSGRPAGIRSCDACDGGIILEWYLTQTAAAVVLGSVDVELRRFNSGRTAELLTPLPAPWTAKIAADELREPELSEDRVLEELVARAGLHG